MYYITNILKNILIAIFQHNLYSLSYGVFSFNFKILFLEAMHRLHHIAKEIQVCMHRQTYT